MLTGIPNVGTELAAVNSLQTGKSEKFHSNFNLKKSVKFTTL